LGDIDALKPRLWFEAVRQSISTAPQETTVDVWAAGRVVGGKPIRGVMQHRQQRMEGLGKALSVCQWQIFLPYQISVTSFN
jgi:hypothetical protein